jgi:hypothetical protein
MRGSSEIRVELREVAVDAGVSLVMGCSLSVNAGSQIAPEPPESTSREGTEPVARMSACA